MAYQGTHPKAKEARARRIEQAKRHTNERQRRNLTRMANVADAPALTDEIALERLYGAMHEGSTSQVDDHAEWMAYATRGTTHRLDADEILTDYVNL